MADTRVTSAAHPMRDQSGLILCRYGAMGPAMKVRAYALFMSFLTLCWVKLLILWELVSGFWLSKRHIYWQCAAYVCLCAENLFHLASSLGSNLIAILWWGYWRDPPWSGCMSHPWKRLRDTSHVKPGRCLPREHGFESCPNEEQSPDAGRTQSFTGTASESGSWIQPRSKTKLGQWSD